MTKVTAYKYKSLLAQQFPNPALGAVPLVTCPCREIPGNLSLEWLSAPYCFQKIPKPPIR